MQFNKDDYILGIWFASDKDDDNVYIFVKRTPNGQWRTTFRYHVSPDPHDDKDVKRTIEFSKAESFTEDEMLEDIDKIFNFVSQRYDYFKDVMMIQGDTAKFLEIAKTKSWMHIKAIN
jgi:hypothetical protein